MNANAIIASALRKVGILSEGEDASAAQAQDCLEILNDMVDAWSIERLAIFSVQRNVFPLVAGKQSYLYGQGAPDFNGPRPNAIERASIINAYSNPAQPLELPVEYVTDVQKWAEIPVKAIGSQLPMIIWDDSNYPFRTLSFYPYPNVGSLSVALYAWQSLDQFVDLQTEYQFPPGYARAIKYNLAVELGAEFGEEVAVSVVQIAIASKAKLGTLNSPTLEMRCDATLGSSGGKGIFNWLTGEGLRR